MVESFVAFKNTCAAVHSVAHEDRQGWVMGHAHARSKHSEARETTNETSTSQDTAWIGRWTSLNMQSSSAEDGLRLCVHVLTTII